MHEGDVSLPALNNGQAGQVSHAVVSTTDGQPANLLWDIGLALVVAIAVPLLLKRALESPKVRALFRFSPPKPRSSETMEHFDFDAD